MVNRYLKKCSVSLAIWAMQIKTVLRFCTTPSRLATSRKYMRTDIAKHARKEEPALLSAGGCVMGAATVEISMLPRETKSSTIAQSSCTIPGQMLKRLSQHATATLSILLCSCPICYSQGRTSLEAHQQITDLERKVKPVPQ